MTKFEVFKEDGGKLRVAFFCKSTLGDIISEDYNTERIAEHCGIELHRLDVDFLDSGSSIRGQYIEHLSLDANKKFVNLYKFILDYVKDNNIRICIFFGSGFPWTLSFLNELKKHAYVACYFGDDPEGAEVTSRHYVKNFHYAFCGGIYFDKRTRTSDKYLAWGARKSKFIPLGASFHKYKEPVSSYEEREVDIVYVGGAYFKKILRIYKLKRYFGARMKLYGRGWNYSGSNIFKKIIFYFIKKIYHISEIEKLPKNQLVSLYQNSKIGFNMHMSYGPSNLRTYELPMNGVMQICDCEVGLKELYKLNKEVISYKTIGEAIEKIDYYLKNDKERIRIAEAGYKRARNNYKTEHSLKRIIEEIKKDIQDNYSGLYKI